MSKENLPESQMVPAQSRLLSPIRRRMFLNYAGVTAASAAVLLTGCGKDEGGEAPKDLTNDDFGILNYAYALEQLEAAFYTKVIATGWFSASGGGDTLEKDRLKDIRDHEIAHRDFFKAALGAKAIKDLQVDFSSVDFNSRQSVLETAKTFEDLGVSAYNGAGQYITTPDYLVIAGKIVSVEARHAAYIRDLLSNGSFADNTVVDANGFDKSRKPSEVLALADPFIVTPITSALP